MLPEISPEEAHRRWQAGEIRLVDIREPAEMAEVSIPGALLAPLEVVQWQATGLARAAALDTIPDTTPDTTSGAAPARDTVYFCRSGRRTTAHAERLQAIPHTGRQFQLQGGLSQWEKAGLPVRRGAGLPLELNRQIHIAAGALALVGSVGSFYWPPLVWLAVLVGAGLAFSGLTGFCGMGLLLQRMPWNRQR